ncbi:MAG: hypothetical protein R3C12_21405 [Planctomycetaceae bacterium]
MSQIVNVDFALLGRDQSHACVIQTIEVSDCLGGSKSGEPTLMTHKHILKIVRVLSSFNHPNELVAIDVVP